MAILLSSCVWSRQALDCRSVSKPKDTDLFAIRFEDYREAIDESLMADLKTKPRKSRFLNAKPDFWTLPSAMLLLH